MPDEIGISQEDGLWSLDQVIPGVIADLVARAGSPQYERWARQVRRTGGCAHPVHLVGSALGVDPATGEVVTRYSSDDEPDGQLLVPCGDRRAVVCPACSAVYRVDTFHLIRAGLLGGKGVPDSVREHPRLFVTLTAPSFGAVHTQRERGFCQPRRKRGSCPHGTPYGCSVRHEDDDPALGTPICANCYDYSGAVLWQAHAGQLWRRFTTRVRRELAAAARIPRSQLGDHLRVSYAKVAEFQRRGLVHFHAVIRLDGPDGPATAPPVWADAGLLDAAIRRAVKRTSLWTPVSRAGDWELRFGDRLDIQAIPSGSAEQQVAGYVAKYATKATEDAGITSGRLRSLDEVDALNVTPHIKALITTAWRLGGLREFEDLRLRRWAHMLAYAGHFSTKSRLYSTTLGELRAARADHVRGDGPVFVGQWRYAGRGYRDADALLAAGLAAQLRQDRELGRDAA